MKMTKFKNVAWASNRDGLISVFCDHEKRGSEYYNEYFFLNNDFEVKAHFASSGVMRAEQLCKQNETLFEINESLPGNFWERKNFIVRVNPDLSYEVLHEIERISGYCPFAIKKNGLWGFIDANGVEFIKPQYDDYCTFKNGYAYVKKGEKWGFINKDNKQIIPFEYDKPYFYCDAKNPVKCDYNSEFVNYNGKLLATVAKDEKCGIIDNDNNTVIPFEYEGIWDEHVGKFIIVQSKGEIGVIDMDNNIVVPFDYEPVDYDYEDNYCNLLQYGLVSKNGLVGLFDLEIGTEVISCSYKKILVQKDSIIAKKQNNKFVLITIKNKEISEEFDEIRDCNDGIFVAVKKDKCAFMNNKCEILTPFEYDATSLCPCYFHEGLCKISYKNINNGIDIINGKCEVLYHANRYLDVYNIGNGYILAENDNNEFEFIKLI